MLRGGKISENQGPGVTARNCAKVTVAKAEEGKPQTVCKDNERYEWHRRSDGEITGIPPEKVHADSLIE